MIGGLNANNKKIQSIKTNYAKAIKGATERLQNVSHKIASAMYQQAGGPEGGPQPGAEGAGPQPGAEGQTADKKDDDVVDADFKEV